MKRGVLLIMLGCLCGYLHAADVDALIERLGSDALEERIAAQERLELLADVTPRQMILRLADAYRTSEDLEVEARLEAVLSQLAREWIFYQPPGFMGINFRMVTLGNKSKAIEVLQVIPGAVAEGAGIRENDRIVEFNGTDIGDIPSQEAFVETIAAVPPGSLVEVVVLRNEQKARIRFTLGLRDVDYMNIPEASRSEEEKLRDWLISLKKVPGLNRKEPLGHFRAAGIPESVEQQNSSSP